MAHANQYVSPKRNLMMKLNMARYALRVAHCTWYAQELLRDFRNYYATIPASTRRRWKCGR